MYHILRLEERLKAINCPMIQAFKNLSINNRLSIPLLILAVTSVTFPSQGHNSSLVKIKILQWNFRGIQSKLPDLQLLAEKYNIFCIQETLLSEVSRISVRGFYALRYDIVNPGLCGICFLLRSNIKATSVQLPFILHHSIKAAAITLLFQDSELLVLNVYRHSNNDTPAHALNDIFNFASGYKYALIVGDLNAHHRLCGCARNDNIGNRLASRIESHNYLILNDFTSTRFNPNTNSGSIIDLALASLDLAGVCCLRTLDDPMANDHYPIETIINGTAAKVKRFAYKLKLSDIQLCELSIKLEKSQESSIIRNLPITNWRTMRTW
ncbi:uncharacterized protein LOC112467498 [Temnothorax curvispinosus]|uniref:Uncharacterized protein LOC112467373 n=1 Tax=Temnothorax curvispinosus TaxID=300111 RepID=A0A6J1RAJ7_9HYME|nr:uncharacterized protein LOC112467373 [Temnothorax curvispinosus]XP_024891915.1 uncharacterized protein LOC112467498 [Temnothorax curvispinosus]